MSASEQEIRIRDEYQRLKPSEEDLLAVGFEFKPLGDFMYNNRANTETLHRVLVSIMRSNPAGLKLAGIEAALRDYRIEYGHNDLVTTIWRLAANHIVTMTPDYVIKPDNLGDLRYTQSRYVKWLETWLYDARNGGAAPGFAESDMAKQLLTHAPDLPDVRVGIEGVTDKSVTFFFEMQPRLLELRLDDTGTVTPSIKAYSVYLRNGLPCDFATTCKNLPLFFAWLRGGPFLEELLKRIGH